VKTAVKRSRRHDASFASLTEELKRITIADLQFHQQLLDTMSGHPSDFGIVSALAVTAAVVKVSSKPLEAVINVSKPWYRKTSFREAAMSIRSVSSALSAGNSPGGSNPKIRPTLPLHHQRVSSLKIDNAKPANGGTMHRTNSQSVPVMQSKPVVLLQEDRMTTMESFSSVVTSPSTESSLASPSSLEQLQPQQEKFLKTLTNFRKEESNTYKQEFKVTKLEDERAVFNFGSDDDDDDNDAETDTDVSDVKKNVATTCPVTRLNTLLNANIHQTSEGDAIRKQLASDPGKGDDGSEATLQREDTTTSLTISASDSRIFNEQRPILTVEPPSPMPSFSLPDPNACFGDATNNDLTSFGDETYDRINSTNNNNNMNISNSRRNLTGDPNNTVTFSERNTSLNVSVDANTCSCNLITNKNKLTVPVLFDLVSLNLGKLSGERRACQRSHSASVHDQRKKNPANCSGSGTRCSSLSPANSFRSILAKRPINHFPVCVANPPTNFSSSPSSSFAAFHRSMETDPGHASHTQKLDDLPRNELDRPSPDQDLGCSPRGPN
jgi:hypothetical protein